MRLLIVDDEPMTRDSLVELLPLKTLGILEVQTASNGRAAWQMALGSRPDIVLCDVRMPKMDGLELSRKLREAFPDIKIIFISGYADKEYLKTAITLEAVGYVEKPIDMEELTRLVEKAVGQIMKARDHSAENERLLGARREVTALARQQLLSELFRSPSDPEALRNRFGPGFFDWPDQGLYAAACVKAAWPDPLNTRQVELSARALLEEVTQALEGAGASVESVAGMLSSTRVGIALRAPTPAAFREPLMALVQRLEDLNPPPAFHIGLSACTRRLDGLAQRYQEALGAAQWAAFAEKERLCALEDGRPTPLRGDIPEALKAALARREPSEARRLVVEQTQRVAILEYGDLNAVRQLYEQLLNICLDADGAGQEADPYARMGLLGAFGRLRTLGELMRFLLSRIDQLFPELEIPQNIHPKIAQAIAVIQANLGNSDLSIQRMARQLGLTENYLCALYKKETGTTINRAIIDARLERAKRLLIRDFKLYEVAAQVGFSDPNYFSAVFKKNVGVSPTRYRREHGARFADGQEGA
jgi:two-component system response regulator YesN